MFFDVFADLCIKNNESPNKVAKKLNIASGTVSEWKKGREPQHLTIKKIADYFNVSIDYLLGREDAKKEEPNADSPQNLIIGYGGNGVYDANQNKSIHDIIMEYDKPERICAETDQEAELLRIFRTLSMKDKTKLMFDLYQIEDNPKK